MCVVSFVGDHFNEKWDPLRQFNSPQQYLGSVNRLEFESLKREVEDLKKLLAKAKEYDIKNNEPNCEMEEKMEFLKKVANLVGIDLDEIINGNK